MTPKNGTPSEFALTYAASRVGKPSTTRLTRFSFRATCLKPADDRQSIVVF